MTGESGVEGCTFAAEQVERLDGAFEQMIAGP